MMLNLWKPWTNGSSAHLPTLTEEFEHLVKALEQPFSPAHLASFVSPVDLTETDRELRLSVDLPGHDPKQVKIQAEGNTLTIESERKPEPVDEQVRCHVRGRTYGTFKQSFTLPQDVDASRTEARFENGTLTITLPKREEARSRVIEVKVKSQG
jgi:HSP20 family protein